MSRVRRNKAAGELVPFADIDQPGIVFRIGEAHPQKLFEHDGDLDAVRRSKGVELEGVFAHGKGLFVGRACHRTIDIGKASAVVWIGLPNLGRDVASGKVLIAHRGSSMPREALSKHERGRNNTKGGRENGGQGQNRTADTRIFSPLLYRLSYLARGGVFNRRGRRESRRKIGASSPYSLALGPRLASERSRPYLSISKQISCQ